MFTLRRERARKEHFAHELTIHILGVKQRNAKRKGSTESSCTFAIRRQEACGREPGVTLPQEPVRLGKGLGLGLATEKRAREGETGHHPVSVHRGLTLQARPHRIGLPRKTHFAPRARAFSTSLPVRTPPSRYTSSRPCTAATTSGKASTCKGAGAPEDSFRLGAPGEAVPLIVGREV